MFGYLAAFRSITQTALALGLCLLALSFVMEAKLAWCGPVARMVSEVRASKALPDDAPTGVHGVSASYPVYPRTPFAIPEVIAAYCAADAQPVLRRSVASKHIPSVANRYFVPYNFLRSPPLY
jgi:hypothetical protein